MSLLETDMSISSVTSEALQLKLRQLLPSQQGFGTDLSASDTIIPIIDLTAAAEGSDVGADLQQALAFGSQTSVFASSGTSTLINTTGFFRVIFNSTVQQNALISVLLTDGAATKEVYRINGGPISTYSENYTYEKIFYFAAGESLTITVTGSASSNVTTRQIADNNGTLVQPVGFTPQ